MVNNPGFHTRTVRFDPHATTSSLPPSLNASLPKPGEKYIARVPLNFDPATGSIQRTHFTNAYDDALSLASAAEGGLFDPNYPIFQHYFAKDDARFVKEVFHAFTLAAVDPSGNSQIRDVVIGVGDPLPNSDVCKEKIPPTMFIDPSDEEERNGDPANVVYDKGSKIRACPKFFDMQSWIKGVSCEHANQWWPKMNWNMASPGSSFLHEWMHYDSITLSANGDLAIRDNWAIIDNEEHSVYGPYSTKKYLELRRTTARDNADNFVWYAIEAFWSQKCTRTFQPAVKNDEWPNNLEDESYPVTSFPKSAIYGPP